jgi:hypothetical protein
LRKEARDRITDRRNLSLIYYFLFLIYYLFTYRRVKMKKNGFKGIIGMAAALSAVLVFGFVIAGCASALATSGNSSSKNAAVQEIKQDLPVAPAEDFEYTINDGEITITNYIGSNDSVRVPDKINDVPVKKIATPRIKNLKTIIIPEGVISIGNEAFGGNPKGNETRTITLPDSVKSLGFFAFMDEIDDVAIIATKLVAPYTAIVSIGANVQLSSDLYAEELPGSYSLPIMLDDYYIKNGRKAGVYTIRKNSSTWSYSAR